MGFLGNLINRLRGKPNSAPAPIFVKPSEVGTKTGNVKQGGDYYSVPQASAGTTSGGRTAVGSGSGLSSVPTGSTAGTNTGGSHHTGGGGGGGSSAISQQGFTGSVDVYQGQTLQATQQLQNGQLLATYKASQGNPSGGFSGRVESSNVYNRGGVTIQENTGTRYYAGGQEVGATSFTGKGSKERLTYTSKGSVAKGGTATITTQRGNTTQQVQLSQADIQEIQFQQNQQSAGDLLFGGGSSNQPTQTEQPQLTFRERLSKASQSQTYGEAYNILSPPEQRRSLIPNWVKDFGTNFYTNAKVGVSRVTSTNFYQTEIKPRNEVVIRSPEFDLLSKTVARGVVFSPTGLVSAVPEKYSVDVVGTLKRTGKTSELNVGGVVNKGKNSLNFVAGQTIKTDRTIQVSRGTGYTFKSNIKEPILSSVDRLYVTNPQKFVSRGVSKNLGEANRILSVGDSQTRNIISYKKKIGSGSASQSRIYTVDSITPPRTNLQGRINLNEYNNKYLFAFNKGRNLINFAGGESDILRIYKQGGVKSVIKNPNIKGRLVDITSKNKNVKSYSVRENNLEDINRLALERFNNQKQIQESLSGGLKSGEIQGFSDLVSGGVSASLERLSVKTPSIPKVIPKISSTQKSQSYSQPSVQSNKTILRTKNYSTSILKSDSIERSKSRGRNIQKSLNSQTDIQQEIQKALQVPKLREDSVQRQRERTVQIPKLKQKLTPREKNPTPPFPPKFPFPPAKGYAKLKPYSQPKQKSGRFTAQERRFGVFKSIGVGNFKDVFNLGRKATSNDLGATFRVLNELGKPVALPSIYGYYKKKDKKFGELLIEKKTRRLKKKGLSSEVPEIQYYKNLKKGYKPKKIKVKGGKKKKNAY